MGTLFLSEKSAYKELQEELKELTTLGKHIAFHTGEAYSFKGHPWTALKLVFLKLYTPLYTSIIRKRFKNMVYIDLFAGSGLNTYEGYKEVYLPGSPIIAWSYATISFDKMFLVEKNDVRARMLEKRMEFVVSSHKRFNVFCNDANRVIYRIMNRVEEEKSTHYLAFIDPTAFEVKWSTFERLLTSNIRGDIILLFHSRNAARIAGKVLKGEDVSSLFEFFGNNTWLEHVKMRRNKRMEEALTEYLIDKIKRTRSKVIVNTIRVKLRRKVHYLLIFVTNVTKSGNPWLKKMQRIKEFIEKTNPETVDTAIREILGKTITLHRFL